MCKRLAFNRCSPFLSLEALFPQIPQNRKHRALIIRQKTIIPIQEIVLCGLSRAGFFRKAAFYGGTALRIFHNLDRFSEDLDFSLKTTDESFLLSDYFSALRKEIASFGLNVEISEKVKSGDSAVQSAFLKGNTKEHMLMFYEADSAFDRIASPRCKRGSLSVASYSLYPQISCICLSTPPPPL
ncbi:MAG: nucleotidyl transferase AbiEii/AbiGii toxin family protein [Spirochaetales bacterium]|nr:nucleotidyl transferase AbiEii/AbiGii toxin family protein [Spirochaetales bacterium]